MLRSMLSPGANEVEPCDEPKSLLREGLACCTQPFAPASGGEVTMASGGWWGAFGDFVVLWGAASCTQTPPSFRLATVGPVCTMRGLASCCGLLPACGTVGEAAAAGEVEASRGGEAASPNPRSGLLAATGEAWPRPRTDKGALPSPPPTVAVAAAHRSRTGEGEVLPPRTKCWGRGRWPAPAEEVAATRRAARSSEEAGLGCVGSCRTEQTASVGTSRGPVAAAGGAATTGDQSGGG